MNPMEPVPPLDSGPFFLGSPEAQYRAILGVLDEGIVLRDATGRVQAANDAVMRIFDGDPWCMHEDLDERRDLIREDGTPMLLTDLPFHEVLATGQPVSRRIFGFLRGNAQRAWVQASAHPLLEQGRLQGVVCSLTDVTEQRVALEALRHSEQELSSLLATLPDLIFHLDARGTLLDYRGGDPGQLALSPETFLGRDLAHLLPALAEPALAAIRACLQTGHPQRFSYLLPDATGRERTFEARIIPHRTDEVLAIVRDMSEVRRQEQAAQAALREKDLLLKEIHHRVKNNLQVVSSLLRLQAATHAQPAVRQALDEAQERIQAIALIHQKLKHAPDATRLDLPAYVRSLAERLVRSYASAPALVDLQVQVAPVQLGPDDAVPLGLILNELISNTLQHGFPPGEGGSLEISIEDQTGCPGLAGTPRGGAQGGTSRTEGGQAVPPRSSQSEGQVQVRVADSGVGLPDGVDLDHGGLGFQLIQALAGQLGGSLELERRRGAAFRLSFTPRSSRDSHDA